jgi:hypothetical protein
MTTVQAHNGGPEVDQIPSKMMCVCHLFQFGIVDLSDGNALINQAGVGQAGRRHQKENKSSCPAISEIQ